MNIALLPLKFDAFAAEKSQQNRKQRGFSP
jgi:hypothetical protein